MTAWSQYNIGAVTPSEIGISLQPKYPQNKLGIMYCHAAGSDGSDIINPYGNQGIIMQKLASNGYNCFSGQHGGPQTWGNQVALNAMSQSYNYIQSMNGTKPGKVALITASMGGAAAFNWTAANPNKVSCIVATIPVINLTDIKINDRQGYGSLINAAYGGSWLESTYGATYNPQTIANSGVFNNIPILIFYGLSDTTCIPSETVAFANKIGSNVELVSIPTGHELATYNSVDQDRIISFMSQHNI